MEKKPVNYNKAFNKNPGSVTVPATKPDFTVDTESLIIAPESDSVIETDNTLQLTPVTASISNCTKLNIRSSVSVDSEIIGVLKKGDVVTIISSESSAWSAIEFNGISGFCLSEYLTI